LKRQTDNNWYDSHVLKHMFLFLTQQSEVTEQSFFQVRCMPDEEGDITVKYATCLVT